MRVLVAGASGVVGLRLVPRLIAAGHDVVAMTRTREKVEPLRALGAEPVVADALDGRAVDDVLARAAPEVVVHLLTAIPRELDFRHMAAQFERTNRLRTEGTDHLVAAAARAGVRRVVAQSFAPFLYAREGGPVKTEEDPLDPDPPGQLAPLHAALRHLEDRVLGGPFEALVLRYGTFYGPGTALGPGGSLYEAIRRRAMPVVGEGTGVWSFVHVDDVAAATARAVEQGPPGAYNVCDDEPARASVWIPHLVAVLGAPPPRRIPVLVARLAIGAHGVAYMASIRGASNAKAKRLLGWTPTHPTWRDGFRTLVSG